MRKIWQLENLIRHISDMQRFGNFLHISPPKNNLNSLHCMYKINFTN
jgi:hypothetical protein